MKPLEFLRSAAVETLLQRASESTAIPVSIHYVTPDHEGPKVAGCGACAMCAHVATLPQGRRACGQSRTIAARAALKRDRAETFLCHLRFFCVAIPVLDAGATGFVLTVGPFCPSEAPEMLEHDVRAGLIALGAEPDEPLPATLSDVVITPAIAPARFAQWLRDLIAAEWSAACAREIAPEPETLPPPSTAGVDQLPQLDPFQARAIAVALRAVDSARARSIVTLQLHEANAGVETRREAVWRARSVSLVFAVLEACASAGMDTKRAWTKADALLESLAQCDAERDYVDAVMEVLNRIVRASRTKDLARAAKKDTTKGATDIARITGIVRANMAEGIALASVAHELGVHPTAITHRLQRSFGMSFSQYVARMRLDAAKDLLKRTNLSVADIARRVGINDASNLGKLFRRFEHLTPVEYRERFGRAR